MNDVLIELVVCVEKERHWRRRQEEHQIQRREDEAKRWQQEQERRNEEQKVNELNQMLQNWQQAHYIRHFTADVKSTIERRKGPIKEGSDLSKWIKWALEHADTIDPLVPERTEISEPADWKRPINPR